MLFLGVLFSGPTFSAEGEIIPKNIPTVITSISQTDVMINLGYYIKSAEVLTLCSHAESLFRTRGFLN